MIPNWLLGNGGDRLHLVRNPITQTGACGQWLSSYRTERVLADLARRELVGPEKCKRCLKWERDHGYVDAG